ncbi:DNA-directed RNA polymerase III subunit Rpc31-domain-containing protein [Sordaria brevicollis]|uniref:DNA-directed RNA polymerase III subunit n=1 Tax=Sordaria brevicollis TaxID=83679 RepID=A0AAE0PHP7_SORBR|nr:DNA-directed RNA polymerase III subunit Rpc31-domain-containing protein [Sordaria brevicollis]
MSARGGRGGRGGGRGGGGGFGGGRGGRRAVAANSVPWQMDPTIALDGKPSELFPPYNNIPKPPLLTKKDDRQVSFFLSFREQCHDSPLYTQSRTWATSDLVEKSGSLFGSGAKATIDIFEDGVPSYSHKFLQKERTLPELVSRPFAKEFFPGELHATLDGVDGPASKRRKVGGVNGTQAKTIALSSAEYRSAEDIFGPQPGSGGAAPQEGEPNYQRALQLLDMVAKKVEDGEDVPGILTDDDEDDWVKNNEDEDGNPVAEEDDDFEEDSGDDYNAEQYFDGNQDDDDYDEGGDEGGDYY